MLDVTEFLRGRCGLTQRLEVVEHELSAGGNTRLSTGIFDPSALFEVRDHPIHCYTCDADCLLKIRTAVWLIREQFE